MNHKIVEVRGSSLTGILQSGDQVVITETKEVVKEDLVVFYEHPKQLSIKVCKGVVGDKITINSENKEIRVNGVLAPVKLRNDIEIHLWRDWLRFESSVPSGYVFLLGTTDDSIDSRSRGYFNIDEQVLGKAHKVATANAISIQ